jgi:hypothetical protein
MKEPMSNKYLGLLAMEGLDHIDIFVYLLE